jgi:hypothetical protein
MSLVPDPIEPKLFEYTTKIQKERNRRSHLMNNNFSMDKLVENDILINENFMKDTMKMHMESLDCLN